MKTAQLQSNHEAQLESSHPVDSLARVKSPYIRFSLEPVTVQQYSRQPVDSSAGVKITLYTIQIESMTIQQNST